MGRTDGKLINFLREGISKNLYANLNYEGNDEFSLEFLRFDKSKEHLYEEFSKILLDWYECNGNGKKYTSYSNAKAVFLAALKKSIYLISLPSIGNRIRFRFATSRESEEKKRVLKEKEKLTHKDPLYSTPGPLSACSSGYGSGEDTEGKISEVMENYSFVNNEDHLQKCLKSDGANDDLLSLENVMNELLKKSQVPEMALEPPEQDILMPDILKQDILMPKVEFYWQLVEKLTFDSVLLLTFNKQFFIENEGSCKPGDVVIPDEVWENKQYNWINMVELDEKLFLFFQEK